MFADDADDADDLGRFFQRAPIPTKILAFQDLKFDFREFEEGVRNDTPSNFAIRRNTYSL